MPDQIRMLSPAMNSLVPTRYCWLFVLVLGTSLAWQCPASYCQNSPQPAVEADLLTVVVEATTTLTTVSDPETARKAVPALDAWRQSVLQSQDDAVQESIQQRMENDDTFAKAFAEFGAEMQRISGLGPETFAIVAEGLSGSSPLDVEQHLNELTTTLKTVTDMASAERGQPDLEKWGRPVFDLVESDGDQFLNFVETNENTQAAYQAYLKESKRISDLGEAIARKVTFAMMSPETHRKLIERAEAAAVNVALSRTRNNVLQIKTALSTYFVEYRRHPWGHEQSVPTDLTIESDAAFYAVLASEDSKRNPRRIRFLQLRDDAKSKDGGLIDAWGKAFRILLDTDYDSKLQLPAEYGENASIVDSIAVDSAGPDGDFATVEDNIRTWTTPEP